MIAGLPWSAWLLLAVSVGLGLGIQLTHYRKRRRVPDRRKRDG